MRATIDIDDELVARGMADSGLTDLSALVRLAISEMVQREAAARRARLGGSDPHAKAAPRRRSGR